MDGPGLFVFTARVELAIPGAQTLKDRRAVIRSIMERLKGRFNVSVADLDGGNMGACRAVLGIAAVSNSREHAASVVSEALGFIEADGRVECGAVETAEL